MLDAGHPALRFEMYAYNYYTFDGDEGYVQHWEDAPGELIEARLWSVGQAAALWKYWYARLPVGPLAPPARDMLEAPSSYHFWVHAEGSIGFSLTLKPISAQFAWMAVMTLAESASL